MIKPSTASKANLPVIQKAKNKYVWDILGNKYLDFTGSNLTVVLGYQKYKLKCPNYPGVSDMEYKVSNLLKKYTNTNDFLFFKNGHNAVDCAIRMARQITHRECNVCFLGYHGVSNEYVSTFNDEGIPEQNTFQITPDVQTLVYDVDILVFESRYREVADKIKAKIRICDTLKEGVSALYNSYDYDFVCYGKSIGNGYPVSFLTGQPNRMRVIKSIYYSTTFGGDNVGLQAIQETIKRFNYKKWLYLFAYATKKLPAWQSVDKKNIDSLAEKGVLYNGYWQIMTCHTKADIDLLAKELKNADI